MRAPYLTKIAIMMLVLPFAGLWPAAATAGVTMTISPTETLTVAAETPAGPGGTAGDIVIRERGSDNDLNVHISAFMNFDLPALPRFSPQAGDTATFSLDFKAA